MDMKLNLFFFFCWIAQCRKSDALCLRNWSGFKGACFFLSEEKDKRTWHEAKLACQQMEGTLMTLDTEMETDAVMPHLSTDESYWMGLFLRHTVTEQQNIAERRVGWEWVDGSAYSWSNWYEHMPTGHKFYGAVTDEGKWIDWEGDLKLRYLCKYNESNSVGDTIATHGHVSSVKTAYSTGSSTWMYIGIGLGTFVFLTMFVLLVIITLVWMKRRNATKDERGRLHIDSKEGKTHPSAGKSISEAQSNIENAALEKDKEDTRCASKRAEIEGVSVKQSTSIESGLQPPLYSEFDKTVKSDDMNHTVTIDHAASENESGNDPVKVVNMTMTVTIK